MSYSPNDSNITPAALAYLHSPEARPLLDQVSALLYPLAFSLQPSTPTVSQIAALRKSFPPDSVHAALTLAQLQPKARQKFPNLRPTSFIYATPEALEQASAYPVAYRKALTLHSVATFPRNPLKVSRVFDLCCGIGGDTLALAQFFPVTAVDLSPVRTACLLYNLEQNPPPHPVEIITGDIRNIIPNLPPDCLVHIDPARRSEGKRSARYADLIPSPGILDDIFRRVLGGVIKLSPAVDFHDLPTAPPSHLELVSHNRAVVQALLWRGGVTQFTSHAPNKRTATITFDPPRSGYSMIAIPATVTFQHSELIQSFLSAGDSLRPPVYIYELDGAFTRAQLAAPLAQSHELTPLTIDGGYLIADHLVNDPALTPFQLLQILPYSESKLIKALQNPSLPPTKSGPIEVKTRGKLPGLDTDHLQLLLSKSTPYRRTVFIFRHGHETLAALAHRIA